MTARTKDARVKGTSKKTTAKKTSAKKTSAKKTTAKKTSAKKTSAPKTSADKGVAARMPARSSASGRALAEAEDVLARLAALAVAEEPDGEEAAELVGRLQALATPALLPAMFGILEDRDPYGVLWSVFYIMEDMDDAYLDALLDALPGLWERAPRWAETALVRIANTRGEPDDCTETLVSFAKTKSAAIRKLTATILRGLAEDPEGLTREQQQTLLDLAERLSR